MKSDDYIFSSNPELMDIVVSDINLALHGRRLVHLSGIFKKIAKQLKANFDDPKLTDEINEPLAEFLVVTYKWFVGFNPFRQGYKATKVEYMNTCTDTGEIVVQPYNIK